MKKHGKEVMVAIGCSIIAGSLGGVWLAIGVGMVLLATGIEAKIAEEDAAAPTSRELICSQRPGWPVDLAARTESPVDDQTRVH